MLPANPLKVTNHIDRYRMHCLWGDINRMGSCLATWEIACRPKEEGGLGITNIQNQNTTLLIKYLDKFYNHADIPWVYLTWTKLYSNTQTPPHARGPAGSFWSKDFLKLIENFRNLTTCSLGKNCSMSYFLDSSPSRVFSLPLSIATAEQLENCKH